MGVVKEETAMGELASRIRERATGHAVSGSV